MTTSQPTHTPPPAKKSLLRAKVAYTQAYTWNYGHPWSKDVQSTLLRSKAVLVGDIPFACIPTRTAAQAKAICSVVGMTRSQRQEFAFMLLNDRSGSIPWKRMMSDHYADAWALLLGLKREEAV